MNIQWNDFLVGFFVFFYFLVEGLLYDVGDEWVWVQDNYDGELQ